MICRCVAIAAICCAGLVVLRSQPSVLRGDANLVLVPVSVIDGRNHPVTGLTKENFRVFDEGVEKSISAFAMEDEPIAVGLIFDRSGSVEEVIKEESAAANLFLKTSNPADDYFLVGFGSKPNVFVPMTHNTETVRYRVLQVGSKGWTALYDAVVLGLKELKNSNLHRKALLLVSDGGENHSHYNKAQVRDIVEESDAQIYSIGFRTHDTNLQVLNWMADLSGGRVIPARTGELGDVAAKIGLELRNRYVLGFPAGDAPRDGKYHRLRVQVVPPPGLPPLQATWRQGYRALKN